MNKKFELNDDEMFRYYENFNPISYKYGDFFQYYPKNEQGTLYQKVTKHENSKNFSHLTKHEDGETLSNLILIYGEQKMAERMVGIYRLIKEQVIGLYLNIDGMERLFSDKYVNFEWKMHMEMNYDTHSMGYYRDHFTHQIKDAYTMDILLNEFGYLKQIRDVLSVDSNSKISSFVCRYVDLQIEQGDYFTNNFDGETYKDNIDDIKKRYFLDNIIKMSCYMSGLFHDIGYPMVHNMKENEDIINYIFDTYNLNNYSTDFNKIKTLLQNTLLFRVVSSREIQRRMEVDMDHGTVSAVVFLLHFYENGAIERLEPYKICAIELAALAIYNHTNRYSYIEDDNKLYDYEKNVFFQNPISHILRISDDLQEWGRVYFEITDKSNIIICNNCCSPIIKNKSKMLITSVGDQDIEKNISFNCNCRKKMGKQGDVYRAFKDEGFRYRRLYRVTTCENMKITRVDDNENSDIAIYLNYNPFRLLHIAYLSPTYAKYRIKELIKTRRLMSMQTTKERMYLYYFVTANIIAIKSEIIGKYITDKEPDILNNIKEYIKNGKNENIENCINSINDSVDQIINSYIKKVLSGMRLYEFKNNLIEYLKHTINIYAELFMYSKLYKYLNDEYCADNISGCSIIEIIDKRWQAFCDVIKNEDKNIVYLAEEYIRQSKKTYRNLQKMKYIPTDYYDEYKDKDIYSYVIDFCDTEKYVRLRDRINKDNKYVIDAYTDLSFFKYIEDENMGLL